MAADQLYYLHCRDCHHEWIGEEGEICEWCNGDSRTMDEYHMFGEGNTVYDILETVKKQSESEEDE